MSYSIIKFQLHIYVHIYMNICKFIYIYTYIYVHIYDSVRRKGEKRVKNYVGTYLMACKYH